MSAEEETERCQKCNIMYDHVWHAPDEIWEEVTGITDGSGLYCITCFEDMAIEKGVWLRWLCRRL